jgi:predicted outer membrane protein
MKRNIFNFSNAVLVMFAVLLSAPTVPAQMRSGSPMGGGQNGNMNPPPGMSPNMQPNGPMAPQNNKQFIEQTTLGSLRRNIDVETDLSKLALKNSSNANVKKFAQQVITDNKKIGMQLTLSASQDNLTLSPEAPGRDLDNTRKAEKQMKKLTGQQFDQMYLVQMDGWVRNDQQQGHSAYAMMDIPSVSRIGKQVWDLSQKRAKQIADLAQEAGFKIQEATIKVESAGPKFHTSLGRCVEYAPSRSNVLIENL